MRSTSSWPRSCSCCSCGGQAREARHADDATALGRWLWLLAARSSSALSLGNHALTLLLAPGIAVYVLLVDAAHPVAALAARRRPAWRRSPLATVVVYAYLPAALGDGPAARLRRSRETWERFWYLVLGQQFQGTFTPCPPPPRSCRASGTRS